MYKQSKPNPNTVNHKILQVVELASLAQLLVPVELARLATCMFIITVARHGLHG